MIKASRNYAILKRSDHIIKGEIINLEGEKITDFKYLKTGLVKLFRRSAMVRNR